MDRVYHCSYGEAPAVKSLRSCVFPANQRMGTNITKYKMHRKRDCAAIYGDTNKTKRFRMSMLSRLLPGLWPERVVITEPC